MTDNTLILNRVLAFTIGALLFSSAWSFTTNQHSTITDDRDLTVTGALKIGSVEGNDDDDGIVTSSEGIENNSNDEKIPTTAAVKEYVDSVNPAIFMAAGNLKFIKENNTYWALQREVSDGSYQAVTSQITPGKPYTISYKFGANMARWEIIVSPVSCDEDNADANRRYAANVADNGGSGALLFSLSNNTTIERRIVICGWKSEASNRTFPITDGRLQISKSFQMDTAGDT